MSNSDRPTTNLTIHNPILITDKLNEVGFIHNGWVGRQTIFKGFLCGKKVKIWYRQNVPLTNIELALDFRDKHLFSSFDQHLISKIMINDVDVKDLTVEDFECVIECNHTKSFSERSLKYNQLRQDYLINSRLG